LASGDIDTMRSFLDFYLRMLPFVNARTKAQFKGVADAPTLTGIAALYEETCTQFGTYMPSNGLGWGCKSSIPHPHGASSNSYIRFHFTGSLELSLMILDLYDHSGSHADLLKYLPIVEGVVEGFRQRFPKKDAAGKTDMWPAQALETYQCKDPTSRANCPANPSTDIAGLMAVLPRLIALPDGVVTAAQKSAWKAQLGLLPPLPQGPAAHATVNAQKIYPIGHGDGFPTTGKGSRSNSENTEMYIAHPFRLFGVGKPTDLNLAQQTYAERHNPCNDGWCQDIIQAAMLNLTEDAAAMLAQRAAATDHGGFRFEGFAGHYQDFMPSLDHYGFMRTGIDYMLMSTVDDEKGSVLLFPTWPTSQWNVRFKMHAPRNTTIEASCQEGKLEYLVVTPPERKADVSVLNCAA
jgi:alpha-L-fucosidase 2